MATVNKDFKIKQGLVVEGTNGTINGYNILTESQDSQDFIIDIIGGETLITSVESTQLEVINGELNVKSGVFDASGAAATAEQNAIDHTNTQLGNYTKTSDLDTTVGGYGYLKSGDLPTPYGDSDVDAHLSGGDGITYSTGAISVDLDGAGGLGFNQGTLGIDRTVVDTWYDANGAAGDVQDNLDDHTNASSGVHGVTGSVVGTTDTQDLSNKRFIDTVYFTDGTTIANEGEIAIRSGSHEFDIQANYGNLNLESTAGDVTLTPAQGHHVYVGGATAGNEVATHSYVDNAVSGLNWKQAVNLLSDANISLTGSYEPPMGLTSIDGHTWDATEEGYRVLLTGQTTDSENGIYVASFDTVAKTYTLTRTEDADAHGELVGAAVFVMEGTTYGGSSWVQGNHYLTDFTGQDWTQFSGSGTVTAGTGIIVNGLEVSVDTDVIATQQYADDAVDAHSDLLTGVHGVTGDVVGTSDQQTLTNKTIDASSNTLSNIGNSSLTNSSITINGNATSLGDNVTLYTDDVDENSGATNQYFTQSRARDSFSAGNAISYNSNSGEIAVDASQLDSDDIAEGTTNLYFTDQRAKDAVASDITSAINALDTDDIEEGTTNKYASTTNVVAALTDQPSIIDLGTTELSADKFSGGDVSGTQGQFQNVRTDVIYSDDLSIQRNHETGSVATASTTEILQVNAPTGRAVKVLYKLTSGNHAHVWEALLAIDASQNVALTEFAEVTTNGVLGSASYAVLSDGKGGYYLSISVTTLNNNTNYKVIVEAF